MRVRYYISVVCFFSLASCNALNLGNVKESPIASLGAKLSQMDTSLREKLSQIDGKTTPADDPLDLPAVLKSVDIVIDTESGFSEAIRMAVLKDPKVLSGRQQYNASMEAPNITKAQKEMQFSSTIYGGIEDVTDETAGVALVLSANKLIFDGGLIDSRILAEESAAKAAFESYNLIVEESAFDAAASWVELEQYSNLNDLISSRLKVLDPLIVQLEKVAAAGVGDVSQVAAAQRTVSLIRVTQMDVLERLEQAKLAFVNIFGRLPDATSYDYEIVSSALPADLKQGMVLRAPAIQANYAAYQSAYAALRSVEAKDNFSVGFETRLQRPFGGSGYDSDEAVGFVVRRTLFGRDKLEMEIEQAKAQAAVELEKLKNTYRIGLRTVSAAQKTIEAMDKAILLASSNAENLREEIDYLRKQLVIGQSTLESVLSAEARLYDAESKEISLLGQRRLAELTVLRSLGLLSSTFAIN